MRKRWLGVLALLGLVGWLPAVRAEDKTKQPALVVRVQSIEGLIADARHLAGLAGREEEAKQAEGFLKSLTNEKGLEGLDTKRPIGLYGAVGPNGINSEAVLLLPLADEKTFLTLLGRASIKPEKDADGIHSFTPPGPFPFPVHFRFAHGYVYATVREKGTLAKEKLLTPGAVFGEGVQGIASVSVHLGSVPANIQEIVVGQTERQLGALKEKQPGETEAARALREQAIDEVVTTLKSLFTDDGAAALSLAMDRKANEIVATLRLTARPGSPLAKRIDDLGKQQSLAAAIFSPEAAMQAGLRLGYPDRLRKPLGPVLDEVLAQIEKAGNNEHVARIVAPVLRSLAPTLKEAETDLAAELRGPSANKLYTVLLASRIKDGKRIEKAVRNAVKELPEAERGKLTFDADKVGEVAIHRLNIGKELDANAKRDFGENPIYAALKDDALFVALGENGLSALKDALQAGPKGAPAFRMTMALERLAPLMARDQLAAPEAAKKAFGGKGGDQIELVLEGGKALQLRLRVQGPTVRFFALLDEAKRKEQ